MERADFRRIANELQEQMTSGVLREGDQLPSTSKLAEHYGVSESTIYRALALLHDRDLITGHIGKGRYVKPRERSAGS